MSSLPETDYRGTRVHRPELDWSQIRETVLMLELMAGQVMAAMRDSDNSVASLTTSFTAIAEQSSQMAERLGQLPDTPELREHKAVLTGSAEDLRGMISQAVVAFQFYDRLVQRLSHVVQGQADFAEIVGDKEQLYQPEAWQNLHERMRKSFSMQEEHLLLDEVLKGVPVEQAISNYMAVLHAQHNDVELF